MKKKKGGKLKWIIIVIVVLGVIGAAAGGSGENETEQVSNADTADNAEKEGYSSDSEEGDVGEGEVEEENELTVGSTFEKKGLKITVNDADLDFTDYSDEYDLYAPADGMKYIMASFTFENTGTSDMYVSIYDFDCYADNSSCEQAYLPDDSNFINTNLSPERNITFQTYYQVPVNAGSIELEYETSFWTNEKAIIKLQ